MDSKARAYGEAPPQLGRKSALKREPMSRRMNLLTAAYGFPQSALKSDSCCKIAIALIEGRPTPSRVNEC